MIARTRKTFVAALAASTGVAIPRIAKAEAFTLRLSHPDTPGSQLGQGAQRFASQVTARSAGQISVEVYPNGQLAKQQETIDGLISGSIDFGIQGSSFFAGLLPSFQVFDTPFMFRNLDVAYKVLEGPIGRDLFASLEPKGMVGLVWGTGNFKEIATTSKPILTPDDMKGMRIRVAGGQIYAALYQSLGAIPMTFDYSETFVALQQHTIDGVDIPVEPFNIAKFYTVAKHLALTNHALLALPLIASKKKLDALPAPLQKIVRDEGRALGPYWRNVVVKAATESAANLKSNGVAFTEVQYAAFRKAMEPVYPIVQTKIGADLFDRAMKAAAG